MKMKCIITDDEPLASEGLAKYIEVIDYLELAGVAQNPLELNKMLEEQPVDLIFLDIQMPFMTGLDFLKIKNNLPLVILTTAHPDYAIEGFQFDVMDYLLKPITFNRFLKATNKAKDYHLLKNQKQETVAKTPDYVFIKCENKYEKIQIEEILFVQALQNYVMIYTASDKYMTLLPLKTVESYLDTGKFIRVHKSYLVAIAKIDSIDNNDIRIQNHYIPISRNLRDQVIDTVVKSKLMSK
ncbi:MAG: LytTR family DNA-binding domain-containing protein [Agriterribacter sp.]